MSVVTRNCVNANRTVALLDCDMIMQKLSDNAVSPARVRLLSTIADDYDTMSSNLERIPHLHFSRKKGLTGGMTICKVLVTFRGDLPTRLA